jgi:hypothetical protein
MTHIVIKQHSSLDHHRNRTGMLSCGACIEKPLCGGINVETPIATCLDLCNCQNKKLCSYTCPNNENFARRYREVRGFGFDDINKHRPVPPALPIPQLVHLLHSGSGRSQRLDKQWVALPFANIFACRSGFGEIPTRSIVAERYKIHEQSNLVLSGVGPDSDLEKWWKVTKNRDEVLGQCKALSPAIVTVPNFSSFKNRPRHETLYNLKRTALCCEEFLRHQIRPALHINCVTDTDYTRLGDFLKFHTEIDAIAIETLTCSKRTERQRYHLSMLWRLCEAIGRPITIIVRGEIQFELLHSTARIVTISSNAHMKTMHRQRAFVNSNGKLLWTPNPTAHDENLDELLR